MQLSKIWCNMKHLLKILGDVLSRHIWVQPMTPAIWEGFGLRCGRAASREINPPTNKPLVYCSLSSIKSLPHQNLFWQDRPVHALQCTTHTALQKFILKTTSCEVELVLHHQVEKSVLPFFAECWQTQKRFENQGQQKLEGTKIPKPNQKTTTKPIKKYFS